MIAYVDCRRGISGTSLLSSLIDAGADVDDVAARLRFLTRGDLKLRADEVVVDAMRTCRIQLDDADARVAEGSADLLGMIAGGGLPDPARDRATDVYRRLAVAEARVHGETPDTVRFEELATLRSVVGVVGSVVALDRLGIETVAASTLPFGGGDAPTHHGLLALPAPATLELLHGMPVEPQGVAGELVTPTGAALIASIASSFGEIPPMTVEAVGIGSAGSATASILTRVVIGRT
jgi:pyridinium-3,5-bisthiocarboxylic acid mononucleotide nickel chelatase